MNKTVYALISVVLFLGRSFVSGHGTERTTKTSHSIRISSDDLDTDVRPTEVLGSRNGQRKRYTLNHPDDEVSFLSLHFEKFDFDPQCHMEITDVNGKESSILSGRGRHNFGTFWSHHIDHSSAIMTIACTGDIENSKTDFLIDRYLAGTDGRPSIREKRDLGLCRQDDRENVQCYEASHPEAFKAANSIVRMQYGNDVCTGWMISPGLLITAGHCVENEEEASNTQYGFNFASTSCDTDVFEDPEIIEAIELVKFSREADYTMLRMKGFPGFKYGYLEMENILPSLDDPIYIPQHPSGRDKELAIFDSSIFAGDVGGLCHIWTTGQAASDITCAYGANFKDFTYICDTEGGSSGAPVISADTNKVVGLHHCGGGCGDNFAIPFTYVYDEVMAMVTENIAAAELASNTMAPSASPNGTGNGGDTSSAAGMGAAMGWGALTACLSLVAWSFLFVC